MSSKLGIKPGTIEALWDVNFWIFKVLEYGRGTVMEIGTVLDSYEN